MLGYFSNDPQKQDKQIRVEIEQRAAAGPALRRPDDPADRRGARRRGCRTRPPAAPVAALTVPRADAAAVAGARRRRGAGPAGRSTRIRSARRRTARRWTPCRRSTCRRRRPPGRRPRPAGGPVGPPPSQPPVGAGEPPGSFPSIPGMGMTNVGPDRNDPFPNRSFADVVTSVEEAPTGRFMFSVGANSFQGLMGGITHLREELRHPQPPDLLERLRQQQGVPRRRPGVADQPPGGHPDQLHAGQRPRSVSLRPADRAGGLRLPVPAPLSQLGRAARRRPGQPRPPDRHHDVCRRVRLGRGGRLLRLSDPGPGRLPGGQRLHPVVRRSCPASGSTTGTTR